jgi:outer membrane protein
MFSALLLLAGPFAQDAAQADEAAVSPATAPTSMPTSTPVPTQPLWELGMGLGVASFPHYAGSDQTRAYVFPFPYVIYRGEFLHADRDGVRGQLLDTDRVDLNISVAGSLPVSSRDDDARAGMPDLKPTIEAGPSLEVHLWRSPSRDMLLDLRLPARLGMTLEASPRPVGWQFAPQLNLDVLDFAGQSGLDLGFLSGPIFADRKYNAHYYSVDPQFATPTRPAFSASGGYSGTQFLMSVSKRFQHYWVGAFVRYDNLAGARFAESPLVKQRDALSGGIAVAWVFGQSSRQVASDE